MPRKCLQGRTCGVSRDGGRARAVQPSGGSAALQLIHPRRPITSGQPTHRAAALSRCRQRPSSPSARRPHRSRDTP
ncbi:hypothetical protein XarCFBP6771_17765 [Xanthomonas arboricola]|nr:hypothetical protein XarCFBP6771_17765 [Xanthomonas arboricola]